MRTQVVVLLLLCGAGVADAQQLDPPNPALGERARLQLAPSSGDSTFAPTGVGAAVIPSEIPTEFVVVPVRVGRVGVIVAEADTLWWEVPARLDSVAPELLRPVKSLGAIRPNWWPSILLILAVLLPVAIWLMRRFGRSGRAPTAFPIAPEPAHYLALRRLDEIAKSGWLSQQAFDRFYIEASHVLRQYLQGRYRVPALDWTSAELVQRLRASGYVNEQLNEVGPLLNEADGVKFAGERPTEHAATEWLVCIRSFVEATAIELRYSTPEALVAARKLTGENP